jgi:hypothetical protein
MSTITRCKALRITGLGVVAVAASPTTALSQTQRPQRAPRGKIRNIWTAMYYPEPERPVPNWPPHEGNFPLPGKQ